MKVSVALGQLRSEYCNLAKNCERHIEWADRAYKRGARIIIFPELSLSGYYLREAVSEVALLPGSPVLHRLITMNKIGIIAGFVEKGEKRRFYNSALLCEDGELIGIYRKTYLPTYGMFEEGRYFSPGRALKTYRMSWGTIGVVICEDAWYPQFVLQYASLNIDVLVVLTASPVKGISPESGIKNSEINRAIMKLYARNLQIPVIFVNKVGYEHGIYFWGGSAVYKPGGAVHCTASVYSEELVITYINVN